MPTGPLFIISGPSGTGKSTIVRRLLGDPELPLVLSVSATTRRPRPGETDGKEYHFWGRERFEAEVEAGTFLEWAEVFGNLYGTPGREVQRQREEGKGVILEIDVQGAAQVRGKCPDAVSIFIKAPSIAVYEQRLRARHTEDGPTIRRRVEAARREEAEAEKYDHQVTNDDLETAVREVRSLIRQHFPEDTDAR